MVKEKGLEGERRVNSKEKSLSSLERISRNGTETAEINFKDGLSTMKKAAEVSSSRGYESSFEIKSFMTERVYTTMLFPDLSDSIGNNLVKIGIGLRALVSAFGYLIEKLKHQKPGRKE